MVRRSNRLPLFILTGAVLVSMVGCSQTEDVVTPVTTTEISLSAERLPTLPTGMVYELWVADATDTVSLGKFAYNGVAKKFLNPDLTPRQNLFVFDNDLLKKVKVGKEYHYYYQSLFVSVERNPDNSPDHGPIMLVDQVDDPANNPLEMRFPLSDSLWKSYVRFNLEGVSDNDRFSGGGKGLWFCRYQTTTNEEPDTIGLNVSYEPYTSEDTLPDTFICDVQNIVYDTTEIQLLPGQIRVGGDTLRHIGVSWEFVYCIDSIPPIEGQKVTLRFDTVHHQDVIDWYTQDGFNLPDYSDWGWKWKGWVVLPSYNTVPMTSRWRLTAPAWRYKSSGINYMPGDNGVLFTTGTFGNYAAPDDANPYKGPGPIPSFPGEDFMNSAALQAAFGLDSVQLLPNATGNVGTVFISLEPTNALTDTTNFPLIAFIQPLPSSRIVTFGTLANRTIAMYNRTATISDDLYGPGFPQVNVQLKRY